jgi:membrane protein YqaA with SNARE-associated domain
VSGAVWGQLADLWVYALAALIVIPSPLLMFLSSEAIAIALVSQGRPPLAVAASLALGQLIGFTLLFCFGEALCDRSARLSALRARLDLDAYRPRATPLLVTASLFGLPPLNLSVLALSTLRFSLRRMVLITLCGRLSRYWVVASLPAVFAQYFDIDLRWLTSWLTGS